MRQQKKQTLSSSEQADELSIQLSKTKRKINVEPEAPKLPSGTRRIKIQPRYVSRVGKNIFVPGLLLQGEWLRKLGFDCKQHVLIREESGGLVIRLEES
jgi:hypothetical protein